MSYSRLAGGKDSAVWIMVLLFLKHIYVLYIYVHVFHILYSLPILSVPLNDF